MKLNKEPVWYTVVSCASGKPQVIYVGVAPSRDGTVSLSTLPREILCPACGNRSTYEPAHFFPNSESSIGIPRNGVQCRFAVTRSSR